MIKPAFYFGLLKKLTSFLFYCALVISVAVMVVAIVRLSDPSGGRGAGALNYDYEVKPFGLVHETAVPDVYAADSLLSYRPLQGHYVVRAVRGAALGYVSVVIKFFFLSIGLCIWWNFKRIFREAEPADPFKRSIPRRLKMLALLFIVLDIVKIIEYVLVNHFLADAFGAERFSLITTVGNNLLIGLIIGAIALIFERGVSLKEENALTV